MLGKQHDLTRSIRWWDLTSTLCSRALLEVSFALGLPRGIEKRPVDGYARHDDRDGNLKHAV